MIEKGSNLPLIKQRNSTLVKEMIFQHSPISRSEIAHMLNLTAPTITACVNPLIAQGLIHEFSVSTPDEDHQLGRRPTMLEFVGSAYYLCGVEVGPYHTYIIITDLLGNILHSAELPKSSAQYSEMLHSLVNTINDFIADSKIPEEKFMGVGVSVAGWLSGDDGMMYHSKNEDWNGHDLGKDLRERLRLPMVIENNVRARAVRADLFDRSIHSDPAVYFYVSYGLACPLIINGRLLYGMSAGAGEIGHMLADPNGPRCPICGRNGCLDTLASEKAIIRRFRTILETGVPTILRQMCPHPNLLTIDHILAAQECDDPVVNSVINECIHHLASTLAGVMNLISPRTVLIDAHLMNLQRNRDLMKSLIENSAFEVPGEHSTLGFVPYDPFGGAKGAAALLVKQFLLGNPPENNG